MATMASRPDGLVEPAAVGAVVAEAMLPSPRVLPGDATVAQVCEVFSDDHQQAVLLVDGQRLVTVVERTDLEGRAGEAMAAGIGSLDGRVVRADADLNATWAAMVDGDRRRLAVVGDDGQLLGLLCLKRSRTGFCTEDDLRARAEERASRT